jgi:hypothetical protein
MPVIRDDNCTQCMDFRFYFYKLPNFTCPYFMLEILIQSIIKIIYVKMKKAVLLYIIDYY